MRQLILLAVVSGGLCLSGCSSSNNETIGQLKGEIEELRGSVEHMEATVASVTHQVSPGEPTTTVAPLAALDETFSLAEAARQDGNVELAEILLLNAANRRLDDAIALERIAEVAEAHSTETQQALLVALEHAVYRVDPDRVSDLLALSETLRDRLVADADDDATAVEIEAAVRPMITDEIVSDPARLASHVEQLGTWIEEAAYGVDGIDMQSASAELTAVGVLVYTENALQRLEKETLPIETAVAILQAAESRASALWGLESTSLSPPLEQRITQIPVKLAAAAESVEWRASEPKLKAVNEAAANAERIANEKKPHQDRIDRVVESLGKARVAASGITHEPSLEKAAESLQQINDVIANLRQSQVEAYQAWVVDQCRLVFKHYGDEWQITKADAHDLFYGKGRYSEGGRRKSLASVDQSLLNAEVSRLFNDVLQKLIVELSTEQVVSAEAEMASPDEKMALSDF